jgi:hypothetical protein
LGIVYEINEASRGSLIPGRQVNQLSGTVLFGVLAVVSLGASSVSPPLTLVIEKRDPNGYPLNPRWAYQLEDGVIPSVGYDTNHCPIGDAAVDSKPCPSTSPLLSTAEICNFFRQNGALSDFGRNCTADKVTIDERPKPMLYFSSGFVAFACYYLDDVGLVPTSVHGHIDWEPVTYTGTLRFSDSNQVGDHGPRFLGLFPMGDGDLDFMLEPEDHQSGLLAGNRSAQRVGLEGNDGMTVEINIPEVLPSITALPYWKRFSENLEYEIVASATPSPAPAVVIGLLNVDTKHYSHTELHPVYGLAVLDQDARGNKAWDLFARDWGYGGGCSASPHPLSPDSPDHQKLRFILDIPKQYGIDQSNSFGSSHSESSWDTPVLIESGKAAVAANLQSSGKRSIEWYHLALRRLEKSMSEAQSR